jgi:hypothetical protein
MDDDAADRIESAVESVERAVERVEKAVKDKWATPQWIAVILVGIGLWSLPGDIWHSKWRYAATYGINSSDVCVQDQPHDCAFFAAPLGTNTVTMSELSQSPAGRHRKQAIPSSLTMMVRLGALSIRLVKESRNFQP